MDFTDRDIYNKLKEDMATRNEKLIAASEIHRYNRDVEETLGRIQVCLNISYSINNK